MKGGGSEPVGLFGGIDGDAAAFTEKIVRRVVEQYIGVGGTGLEDALATGDVIVEGLDVFPASGAGVERGDRWDC